MTKGQTLSRKNDNRTQAGQVWDSAAPIRSVLETAADCIIIIDERGIIEFLNPVAQRLFGYRADETVGKNVNMLMPSPYRDEHDRHIADYVRTGKKKIIGIGREVVGRHKDGTIFPMHLALSEAIVDGRRTFMGVVRDISDLKQIEAALVATNELSEQRLAEQTAAVEELARACAEMDAFTHDVSHDLREPLRIIQAFSLFLLEDYADRLDEQGREYLTKLGDAGARLERRIDDLLKLAQMASHTGTPTMVDVGQVVESTVEGLRSMIEEKDATVEVTQGLPHVPAEPLRIEQIFTNLIGNALKFNESKQPIVRVGIRRVEDGMATFYVEDNGIGIDPRHHERIFFIFQRLHGRDEYEGTGAGLAIVKRAVEAAGGHMWVESELGAGTTFLFTLPVRESAIASTSKTRRQKRSHDAGSRALSDSPR